ncbi:unnamed protein product [Prunus armeniaca]
MADLLYRFKRYNPGKKLNLNFSADPPLLPEASGLGCCKEQSDASVPLCLSSKIKPQGCLERINILAWHERLMAWEQKVSWV